LAPFTETVTLKQLESTFSSTEAMTTPFKPEVASYETQQLKCEQQLELIKTYILTSGPDFKDQFYQIYWKFML
jgi:hypothetical protein